MDQAGAKSEIGNDRVVVVCECFARDGLQHEADFIATATKVALIERFAALGFPRVEATSYSNPKIIPQFADASDVLQQLRERPETRYKATCANERAVERALADLAKGKGANEISLLVSASQSHSERNLKQGREEQWANIARMHGLADGAFRIVGTISVAFGCPFEGVVPPETVLDDVERFAKLGIDHITLGDTTGMATPRTVKAMVRKIADVFPEVTVIAHFHDSRGTGLVNCLAALDAGVLHFDSAFGGVGGHPAGLTYGGGYTGNVCTEDLINLFEGEGIRTGIDLSELLLVSQECEAALQRTLHSRVARTGLNPLIAASA